MLSTDLKQLRLRRLIANSGEDNRLGDLDASYAKFVLILTGVDRFLGKAAYHLDRATKGQRGRAAFFASKIIWHHEPFGTRRSDRTK